MSKVAVVAKLTAQAGKRDELVKVLQGLVDATQQEPGTLVYALHKAVEDENVVWFYELYENADALGAHSGSDAMRAAGGQLGALLGGRPEITRVEPIVAKGFEV